MPFLTLLALLAGACSAGGDTAAAPGNQAGSPSPAATGDAAGAGIQRRGDLVLVDVSPLVRQVRGGVVAVSRTRIRLDAFLQPRRVPAGAGTGIVIDDEGHVLTNYHVVADADRLTVTTPDGTERRAELVGSSPDNDLALLKVDDTSGLKPLPLGSSGALEVGDPVVAIGNALALGQTPTVSTGIVSAKGRTIQTDGVALQGLLQTDAAINPGNSGGPLLNAAGEVVGVNTAIAGGAENIGFAIAMDRVKPVIERLLAGRGESFIGVSIIPNSPQLAAQLDLATDRGVVVARVAPGGPADQAGLRQGDVIVSLGDRPVEDAQQLVETVEQSEPGTTLSLRVIRGDRRLTVEVTVGQR